MKTLISVIAGLAMVGSVPSYAQQSWKPGPVVQFTVPAGPGGSLDMVARQIQKIAIEKKLVESMIVQNKPGGALAVALNELDKQAGNGDYLMTLTTSLINNNITGSLKGRTFDKYTPISILFQEYVGLIVHNDSPFKTAKDLVDFMKENPDKLNVALASSLGNHIQVGAALPLQMAGVDVKKVNFVAYKSSAESIGQLLGRHVDVVSASTPNFLTALKNDQLRILVVGSPKRLSGDLSFIPTWKEEGIDVVTTSVQGIIAPANLTQAQIDFWGKALAQITNTAEWKQFVELRGWNPDFIGPDRVNAVMTEETARIQAILDTLGLSKNK